MVNIISYDLRKPIKHYTPLINAIEALGDVCRPLMSVWLVDTPHSAIEIRDYLKQYMDRDDQLLVTRATLSWASNSLSPEVRAWLKEHMAEQSAIR